jgi:HSP90 family molecular chaperone
MNTETLEFQAEERHLLQDVFLSELIPNASDALGERRLAGLADDSLGAVQDVRLTPRLTSSPACVVSGAEEPAVTAELFTDRLTRTV